MKFACSIPREIHNDVDFNGVIEHVKSEETVSS